MLFQQKQLTQTLLYFFFNLPSFSTKWKIKNMLLLLEVGFRE
jgi:hypothetical protein